MNPLAVSGRVFVNKSAKLAADGYGWHMLRYQKVTVSQAPHPVLACINVLQFGSNDCVVGESFCCCVIHLQTDRARKFDVELFTDVAKLLDLTCGIVSSIDFD